MLNNVKLMNVEDSLTLDNYNCYIAGVFPATARLFIG